MPDQCQKGLLPVEDLGHGILISLVVEFPEDLIIDNQ
jgi:hypothetical protein